MKWKGQPTGGGEHAHALVQGAPCWLLVLQPGCWEHPQGSVQASPHRLSCDLTRGQDTRYSFKAPPGGDTYLPPPDGQEDSRYPPRTEHGKVRAGPHLQPVGGVAELPQSLTQAPSHFQAHQDSLSKQTSCCWQHH